MPRRLILFLLISLLAALPPALQAKAKRTPLPSRKDAALSRDYLSALAAADRFLHAWQAEDHEAGLLLLSDAAKSQTSETKLNVFFAPDTSPQRAFQISHGKKLRPGRYVFPVSLMEDNGKFSRVRTSQIILAKTDSGDWVVDRLP